MFAFIHRPSKCTSAGRVTSRMLLSFLLLSAPIAATQHADSIQHQQSPIIPLLPVIPSKPETHTPGSNEHVFSLRHVLHGNLNKPAQHLRHDVPETASHMWLESEDGGKLERETRPLVVRSQPMNIHRLKDRHPSVVDPMVAAARQYSQVWTSNYDAWTLDDVPGPDITDPETVLTFAQMAANSYVEVPNEGDWKDVNGGFNRTDDNGFGWDSDGLRGYLYLDETNSTVVIGLKGTTLAIWDGHDTTTNDKENDNLYFSCCCGQQGSSWYRQVCNCATGTYTCNISCLKKSLVKENRYYAAARQLYGNVTAMYPNSQIWMSGHSLGGAVSAWMGLTYGIPVLTFEAVPDALPASRLGLPVPPGIDPDRPGQRELTGAYHFGQNADPIYMGTCNGATASCTYAGYALESACHSGRECVWDVVNDNGTRVNIITHRIIWVINNVIKKYKTVPECKFTPECYDCPLWKDVTGNHTATTSSTTSTTRTQTRTSTCQTPGWWGCLDETTTTTTTSGTSISSSTTTTSTSTSTCKTPGWFGCYDETTTSDRFKTRSVTVTSTSTSTSSSSSSSTNTSSSTTCATPGWFGCNDPTTTSHETSAPTSTCETPGRVWGCYDTTSTSQSLSHPITSPPPMPTTSLASPDPVTKKPPYGQSHCVSRSWLGFCKRWENQNDILRKEI